jgi:hypothetical protein
MSPLDSALGAWAAASCIWDLAIGATTVRWSGHGRQGDAPTRGWERAMKDHEIRRAKARGGVALVVAAATISVLGLAGPVFLALGRDPDVLWPIYVVGWPLAIAAWLYWLRCWRARTRR